MVDRDFELDVFHVFGTFPSWASRSASSPPEGSATKSSSTSDSER